MKKYRLILTTFFTLTVAQNCVNAQHIAGGGYHSLFLCGNGNPMACGYGGALGDGTNITKKTPVQINSLSGITAVSAGYEHSLFLKNDRTVWACGSNDVGELGYGTWGFHVYDSVPVQIS